MRYYEKIGPAQNTATVEKRLIDQLFEFERDQCDMVRGFDLNECERKRKLDKLNAELAFSIGTDAAGMQYTERGQGTISEFDAAAFLPPITDVRAFFYPLHPFGRRKCRVEFVPHRLPLIR
jgi:hypothetical protein